MNIRVYSTFSCPWCMVVKKYLRDQGVSFEEVAVDQDRAKYEEMVRISRQNGVPVIDFEGEIVVGFNRAEIDRQLAFAHPVPSNP